MALDTIIRAALASAVGADLKRLDAWLWRHRDLVISDSDMPDPGRGAWRRYSLEAALQISIGFTLAEAGFPIPDALRIGEAVVTRRGVEEVDTAAPGGSAPLSSDLDARTLPEPFKVGHTWLVVRPSGDWRLLRVPDHASPPVGPALVEAFGGDLSRGAFVVSYTELYERAAPFFALPPTHYRAASASVAA